MGQLRTIQHPAIEIFENDASGATEQVGGCTSLVVGFFPQGESSVPVNPTTLKSVKAYFGTPETEAERYAYYACKTVFDNGGKLIASRIPYNNNSQYITPAAKYNIEEWSTTHITNYSATNAKKYTYDSENVYTTSEYTTKSDFYIGKSPAIAKLSIDSKCSFDGKTEKITQGDKFVINSTGVTPGTKESFYTLEFNGPFYTSKNAQIEEGESVETYEVKSYARAFISDDEEMNSFSSIKLVLSSDCFINGTYTFTPVASSVTIGTAPNEEGRIDAVVSAGKLTGAFKVYQKNVASAVATINNIIYQGGWSIDEFDVQTTIPYEGMKFNRSIFDGTHSEYFKIYTNTNPEWKNHKVTENSATDYYSETKVSDEEKLSNFIYSFSRSQPQTAWVDKLTETSEYEKVMAIKSYYKSGEEGGVTYPDMTSDSFMELRIWNSSAITALSSLTPETSGCFDIIENEYIGVAAPETTVISNSKFKSAAITADVTTGYAPEGGIVTSETIAISAQDGTFNENLAPKIVERENPVGNGYIYVLDKTVGDIQVPWNENDFYQFVSPYSTVKEIAMSHSTNYNWIHYTVNTALTGEGTYASRILMGSTLGCETSAVPEGLSKVENLVSVIPDTNNLGYIPLSDYLDYRDEAKKVDANTIVIANITEQKFAKDSFNNVKEDVANGEEVLGIVPVLMTGFQALPKQSRIEIPSSITNSKIFNAVETIVRGSSIENDPAPKADHVDVKSVELNKSGYVKTLGNEEAYDPYESTYSNESLARVPSIDLNSNYKPNGAKTNYVTLAVCKLTLSSVNDNKVALTILESFSGSLDSAAKDENGNSVFIDTVVNNDETGSAYVKLFSNYQTSLNGSEVRTTKVKKIVNPASVDSKVTVVTPNSCGSKKWFAESKKMFTLGFVEEQTKKYISYATMVATLENVYDMLSNVDEVDIDLVVDAGLTSIANRMKRYIDANPDATKCEYDLTFDKIESVQDVGGWKSMAAKLITFCQTTRKDCLALIDAPRSLCVKNNVKLIDAKKTTTSKYSVDYDILPKFNFLGGLNSSYGAGFCDWILAVDDFTAKNIWMPPSIAAEGNIIYTDYNSNYWMAPAGEKRGNILWAVDIAFNPNSQQQDSIYSKGWNYAISSGGNIMTWGQKTFLTSTSSFNRINVRRLFLKLERLVRKNSKWVLFELNNQKTRNTYLDRIDPIFANVKAMGGIFDYRIYCNEVNNTPQVRDASEFRAAFAIKPERAAEFIILTFFNLSQSQAFEEIIGEL